MKQLPNIFTLLNLFFGCLAIVCVLQTGLEPIYKQTEAGYIVADIDTFGKQYITIPPQIFMASLFIAIAAVVDFFDGFVARLLKASSELGKQLDSLADVVSFGVAPGMIVYEFLRLSFAQQQDGLDTNILWLLPAFILPCAGAYRLARFNIDTSQSYGFKGVPIPAAGLLIASFPLIFWSNVGSVNLLLINQWFWYAVIAVVSYLMVSTLPMMALKFKNPSLKTLLPFIILAVIAITCAFFVNWLSVPITFVAYVILSLFYKNKS
jgi:CDP-diacylglycerol--serine O-phosphatidyltransferase